MDFTSLKIFNRELSVKDLCQNNQKNFKILVYWSYWFDEQPGSCSFIKAVKFRQSCKKWNFDFHLCGLMKAPQVRSMVSSYRISHKYSINFPQDGRIIPPQILSYSERRFLYTYFDVFFSWLLHKREGISPMFYLSLFELLIIWNRVFRNNVLQTWRL